MYRMAETAKDTVLGLTDCPVVAKFLGEETPGFLMMHQRRRQRLLRGPCGELSRCCGKPETQSLDVPEGDVGLGRGGRKQ